ncbi:MAG: hypothetical protein JXQ27_04305 [Acidobacteria bacterium]|nr:hypothetical protein [Acidobacteriota bacterium]
MAFDSLPLFLLRYNDQDRNGLQESAMGITTILQPECGVILDTCALIYLVKLDLLVAAADGFQLLAPRVVLDEFRHKSGGKPLSPQVARLLGQGKLEVRPVVDERPSPLTGGESACLALARELAAGSPPRPVVVVTDDGKACRVLRNRQIPFLNTPLFICALMQLGRLSAAEAASAIRLNLMLGRYGRDVVQRIRQQFFEVSGEVLDGAESPGRSAP